jgi:hypothetical protein
MSGSSSSSPPHGAEVSSSRRPQVTGRDKTVGSSSRQVAPPAQEDQRMVRSRAVPSGTCASEPQRSAPRQANPPRRSEEQPASARQLYHGSDRPDSDSLQSAPLVAEPSAAPRHLQSLLIRGGGAPDIHVSLVTGGGHGPTPTVAEAGGTAPEHVGESVAAAEATGRSGVVPETVASKRTAPEQGSKRAAPEQGSSDRPVKKARVRSKM